MTNHEKAPQTDAVTPTISSSDSTPDAIGRQEDNILFAAVETTRVPMVVTDPRGSDNPIVFANRAFVSATGYSIEEILGVNCRFLQGPATDPLTVSGLREAVANTANIRPRY